LYGEVLSFVPMSENSLYLSMVFKWVTMFFLSKCVRSYVTYFFEGSGIFSSESIFSLILGSAKYISVILTFADRLLSGGVITELISFESNSSALFYVYSS